MIKNYIGFDAFDREPEGKSNACYSVFKKLKKKILQSHLHEGGCRLQKSNIFY